MDELLAIVLGPLVMWAILRATRGKRYYWYNYLQKKHRGY